MIVVIVLLLCIKNHANSRVEIVQLNFFPSKNADWGILRARNIPKKLGEKSENSSKSSIPSLNEKPLRRLRCNKITYYI